MLEEEAGDELVDGVRGVVEELLWCCHGCFVADLPGLKRFGFWIRFEKRCGHVSYLCLLNKNIYFNLMK